MNLEKIIYCLYCPDDKTPIYVGLTRNGIDRPWLHIKEHSHNKKINKWVNSLGESNKQPVIVILDSAETDEILLAKESFWIQHFISKGYPLLNLQNITAGYFLIQEFDEEDPLRYIRTFIVQKRRAAGLNQEEMAKKAKVGLRFIRDFEQGKRTLRIDKVNDLINILEEPLRLMNFKIYLSKIII